MGAYFDPDEFKRMRVDCCSMTQREIAATAAGGYVRGAGYVVSVTKDGRVLQEDLHESRIGAKEAYDAVASRPSCSKILASVVLDEEGDYDCLDEILMEE